MKTTANSLELEIKKLRAQLEQYEQIIEKNNLKIEQLTQHNLSLLEQIRLGRAKRFAQSSEKAALNATQQELPLFNEAETTLDNLTSEETAEVEQVLITRKKPGKSKARKPLPAELPREIVLVDLPEDEKHCAVCDCSLHRMGEHRVEKLEVIPAKVFVKVYTYPKYSCRHCEKNGTQVKIKQAPIKASPIPKSFASPSLLSEIIVNKYQFALPLNRQEAVLKRYGIDIPKATLSSWVLKTSRLFEKLYERLHDIQLTEKVIHADETSLTVNKDKQRKTSYMWLYATGADSPQEKNCQHQLKIDPLFC